MFGKKFPSTLKMTFSFLHFCRRSAGSAICPTIALASGDVPAGVANLRWALLP
jgi:hypothetical protein